MKTTGRPAPRAPSSSRRDRRRRRRRGRRRAARPGSVKPTVHVDHEEGGRRPGSPARSAGTLAEAAAHDGRRNPVARPHARERVVARLERRPPQRLRRRRRLEARLLLAAGDHLLERRPEVERRRVAALGPLARALRLGRRLVDRAVVGEDDAVARPGRSRATDEPERDVARDRLDRPVEPVLPAAAARRPVDEHVARLAPRRCRTSRAAPARCRPRA